MAATTNQKSYLQKYLGGSSRDKKKKKKAVKGKGFQIIDDDIDLSKLRPLDGDELDVFDEGEDAPQIAGIIDDRPEELKQLDQLRTTSKWKIINQDDGFNSKLQIEEIKKDHKEAEKENELIFGKMYSDSEDEKNNVSISHEKNLKDTSKKHNSDSDFSPLRKKHGQPHKNRISNLENNDSDLTPPKRHSNYKQQSSDQKNNYNSEGDFSPPRRKEGQTHKQQKNSARSPSSHNKTKERVRKPSRWGTKEIPEETNYRDIVKSSSYKSRQDSDESPPRKSRRDYDSRHPSRRAQQTCNSDASPQRRSKKDNYNSYLESISPTKKQTNSPRHNYDHRNYHKNKYKTEKCTRRHSSDSDLSPPRKNKRKSVSPIQKSKKLLENNKRKYNNDSDQSPLRRDKVRDTYDRNKRSNDSPLPTNKKMARTLEGKMAGLQDARQLRHENNEFRRKEDEAYNKMSDEVSGRNAKAVSRKGKRETSEERQKQREKTQRQKELDIKYKKWSRGLKQIEDQEARVQEFIHEAAKPLARHRDDRDLEDKLKQLDRAGDPMLQYIKEKKRERGELAPEKPSYKGSFPPNRFNIRPGYRWDGVDRSNGYEKKFFEQQSKKKAQEEEIYKWSTEDL